MGRTLGTARQKNQSPKVFFYDDNVVIKIKPLNLRYRLQSNDRILLSHPNFKTLKTLDDRAFIASAPKLWNDLPLEIRMAKSVDT